MNLINKKIDKRIKIGVGLTLSALLLYLLFGVRHNAVGGVARMEDQCELTISKPTSYGVETEGYKLITSKLKAGETMSNLMLKYGRTAAEVYKLERIAKEVYPLRNMRAGNKVVSFVATDSLNRERVDYIAYERDPLNYVVYQLKGDSMCVLEGVKPSRRERRMVSATIESSLWGAIMKTGMPYSVGAELESIYQWSVDFFGIQRGDCFTVIYDEIFINDSISIGMGNIQGAKFTQNHQQYYAIPFEQDGRMEYWCEDGGSMRKQMLKAPLKYTRISSKFSNARLHPVLKVYRPHHGVDYAAPIGTPVHSVADGVITYSRNSGAGGNMVKIKHPNSIETGYLHLKSFARGIKKGAKVKQGDVIGYVGSTGISTGPHLDYRVWSSGKAINPLSIPQKPVKPIAEKNLYAFSRVRDRVLCELNGEVYSVDHEFNVFDINNYGQKDNKTDRETPSFIASNSR